MTGQLPLPEAWDRFKAEADSPFRRNPYLNQPFPSELDRAITDLVVSFRGVPPAVRSTWSKQLSFQVSDSQVLLTYAARMATQALREASEDRITAGLLAVLLEAERDDWRENVIVLSLLYDATTRLKADPRKLFKDVAEMAPELPSSETIREFPHRKPEDLSIEAMGYRTSMTPQGVRYEANPEVWRK